jgi:MoaA/NifB/PqqE/SkfB family radical SAM enzyme
MAELKSKIGIIKNYIAFVKKNTKREINYLTFTPTHALLFMTYRCTNRCKMCTIWKRGKNINKKEELTLDDWKKCIDKLCNENIKVIEIFGGDSLLRKDVTIPLIKYIKKKNENIIVDLPTNSNLLDKKTAQDLVKAGLDRLYISLDGPTEIHDKIRGSGGTFNNVQKALLYLTKAKKDLGKNKPFIIINCTISSSNVNNFEQIIPSVEKLGVDGIEFEYVGEFKEKNIQNTNINGIKPTPFYITLGASNLLNKDQAYLLKEKIKNINNSAKKSKIFINTKHIDTLTVENLVNGTVPNKRCYISRYIVTIDPFGNLLGCFHFNNYIFGNIMDNPFSSGWNNKKHNNFFKSQKKGEIKICENCISGVHRNPTIFQVIYRNIYFNLNKKGFE